MIGSHQEHHKFTLNPPLDMEVELPFPITLTGFLKIAVLHPMQISFTSIRYNWKLANQVFEGKWHNYIFEGQQSRFFVFNWSRLLIVGHMVVLLTSLYYRSWIVPVLVSFNQCYGSALFYLCNNTQHVGLQVNVQDFRLCCRTIYLNPVVRFLYWQMNYHIEHHMYAGVPCYNLHKLHAYIQHDLPPTPNGLIDTWFEIIGIKYRQTQEPRYQKNSLTTTIECKLYRKETEPLFPRKIFPISTNYKKWYCSACGFIYDESEGLPEEGIPPGTRWSDIPDDWCCPDCGLAKSKFNMVQL
eukprot:TRINITY_DN1241_c0_g1_i1.p1 TRINITY_DN1241_c0_g1~~TRINITY_DN1241_c0_g1_i1.p1  ORF type:complete len:298 (-),score=29.85 TRINITY_DN1241_c0_g1_i1:36-929(-)